MPMEYSGQEVYRKLTGRKWMMVVASVIVLIFFFILDLMTGASMMSMGEVINALIAPDSVSAGTRVIVWSIRLPVAIMAVVVGASLGVAGAEMQAILDNPLADPYTLGISTAAAFGAGLAVLGIGLVGTGEYFKPINAFAFSLLSCAIIYGVARKRSSDKNTIVLTGIAMLFLFQSLVSLLQYLASSQQMSAILFWLFGSLSRADWTNVTIIGVVLLVISLVFVMDAWKLTALKLGDSKAMSLGVNVKRLRQKVLIGVSLLTATAVSFAGTIGFIGLVGPHISRMLVGDDQRYYLPMSALMGAALLSLSSTVSKLVSPGVIFPIGIITSFIGVPFFIMLILRRRKVSY
ncbi:FecCD family ABC transporter permease [Methanomassiliicoccus luminyensis]|jgi:iron complex transport system permease protein|uniref:FecCD family ABC transporter permease n=1 Tax=Methanomassiliicoccus luminyensis TaxID=1080712 RepID=UPI00036A90B3|nr:iron ABC transporter permease [Methanomassiliicoccus luminyensis]